MLSAVRMGGVVSRTDIGRKTGLSAATVSAITSDLIADGFLMQPSDVSQMTTSSGRGRPKVALSVNPMAALIGVVIFQFNRVSAAVVDYSGTTISESSRELTSADLSRDGIRDALVGCLQEALNSSGQKKSLLMRIAVSVQGVTDVRGRYLLWSPITNHRDLPMAGWMRQAFGVAASVSNDCDLMARALNRREPGRYGTSFASI
ncbi:MAG: sugar kinase, partial [Hyphomicrobiales bacterium]